MTGRVILPLLALAAGGGIGFGLARTESRPGPVAVAPPVVAPAAPAPADADGVVIEVRIKAPRDTVPVRGGSTPRRGRVVGTENPFDLAIDGEGFFRVLMPDGTLAYTRDGAFGLSAEGHIITAEGNRISAEFTVPQDTISFNVGSDGTVSVVRAGDTNRNLVLGQLVLARFANPGGLKAGPDGLLRESERSGCPIIALPGQNGFGLVWQGFRERHADLYARSLLELVGELGREPGVRVEVAGK